MLDFLLFENYRLAQHHKFDVLIIAKMLKSQGLNVAIFDIYHEDKDSDIEGIPVLHWISKASVPDDSWMLRKHSVFETIIKSSLFRRQLHSYMQEVKSFIIDKANNFYCGSYHNGMSTVLFDIQKPCYWWGLRSERFRFSIREMIPSPLFGLHVLEERKRFINNPCQRLFVSNQIIMDEHERLGVPRNRMVIREERVVEKTMDSNLNMLDQNVSFLVIGQLRKEKHIPTTIAAFKKANINEAMLKLIGRSQGEYEEEIFKAIDEDNRIFRLNAFLKYDDFNKHFSSSHFVLFADEEGVSCITNGTMTEALINHRPIICPNYNPYKYYIEKYGFGLLYEAGNEDSYASALVKASKLGVQFFQSAIEKYLHTIQFDVVATKCAREIKNSQTL
mgnify:CR=1 FL=1